MVIPLSCGGGGGVFFVATSSVFFFDFFLCISTTIGPTREDVQYGMILYLVTYTATTKTKQHYKPFFFVGRKKVFVPTKDVFLLLFTGSLFLLRAPQNACVS